MSINGGSSSIRLAVYQAGRTLRRKLRGKIDRIGLSGTNLIVNDSAGEPEGPHRLVAADHRTAVRFLLDWLLGVSGTSPDVRDLLARERKDVRAAEAVELSCYQARKWIGSFAAALVGLDTLVFTAGIGENAPLIGERICDGLDCLGIELDRKRNAMNAPLISRNGCRVKVRVIRTDEELMIARSVLRSSGRPFK